MTLLTDILDDIEFRINKDNDTGEEGTYLVLNNYRWYDIYEAQRIYVDLNQSNITISFITDDNCRFDMFFPSVDRDFLKLKFS